MQELCVYAQMTEGWAFNIAAVCLRLRQVTSTTMWQAICCEVLLQPGWWPASAAFPCNSIGDASRDHMPAELLVAADGREACCPPPDAGRAGCWFAGGEPLESARI